MPWSETNPKIILQEEDHLQRSDDIKNHFREQNILLVPHGGIRKKLWKKGVQEHQRNHDGNWKPTKISLTLDMLKGNIDS